MREESVDGKPVEYLLDGARFKLSFQVIGCDECGTESPYVLVTPLDHYANELNGKWVALVPAENDRHLHIAAQPVRVAELEAETTKLKLDLLTSYGEAEELSGKVAELEAALKVAREGIDKFLIAKNSTEFDCACDLSVGYLCGPCHADKQQQQLLESALAKINEVLHD